MKRLVAVIVAVTMPMPAFAQSTWPIRSPRIRVTPIQGPRRTGLALDVTKDALVFLPDKASARVTIPFSSIAKLEVTDRGVFASQADAAGRTTGLVVFTAGAVTVLQRCGELECGAATGLFFGIVAAAVAAGLGVRHLLSRPGWRTIPIWQLQSMIP